MTTKVTVDAHAGWPVLVTMKFGEVNSPKRIETAIVEPNTTQDFHIHSEMEIMGIQEQPRAN